MMISLKLILKIVTKLQVKVGNMWTMNSCQYTPSSAFHKLIVNKIGK